MKALYVDILSDEQWNQPARWERHHRVVEGGVFLKIFGSATRSIDEDRLDRGDKAPVPLGRFRPRRLPVGVER
jgi:hypothetical protein